MNKLEAIVLDVDDTLLDFTGGFRDYVNEYYNYGLNGLPEKYSFEGWLPCDMAFKREIMGRFNKSWQFGCLKPLAGAKDSLRWFHIFNKEAKGRYKLILLSKCGRDPATKALRKVNLTNIFGIAFDDIIMIDYNENKTHILSKLQRSYDIRLSVDDYVMNCLDMQKLGIPTVAMRHSTNTNITGRFPDLPVAESWSHLFNHHIKPLFEEHL